MKHRLLQLFSPILGILATFVFVFFLIAGVRHIALAFSWVITPLDTDTGYTVFSTSLAMESATELHIGYCSGANKLYYNTYSSGTTGTPSMIMDLNTPCSIAGRSVDIALDGTTPVLAFIGATGGNEIHYAIRSNDGGTQATDLNWYYSTVTSTAGANYKRLAFDISGSTYGVAFEDTNTDVYYSECSSSCATPANWTTETVTTSVDILGEALDLTYNSSGVPIIAYSNLSNGTLHYAVRNGGGAGTGCGDTDWNCYQVDTFGSVDDAISVGVDSSDNIGIAYQETTSKDLRFAYKDGGNTGCTGDDTNSFTCEVVDTTGFGYFPSINFHGTRPLIAWYDGNGVSKDAYFSYKDTSWTTDTIETDGISGQFASIDRIGDTVFMAYVKGGDVMVAGSTVSFNDAPTVSAAMYPAQNAANLITVTTTIADVDNNVTSLIVEHSTDGTTWASSTIGTATQDGGEGDGVVTSTGNLSDIDTDNDGSIDLTFTWNVATDVADTEDPSVFIRIIPYDGTLYGTSVSSSAFAIDTKAPTAPGALTISSTSTTSFELTYGSTTSTDTNFSEYIIYYSTTTPIDTSLALTLTSSTDSNLASSTYALATTTTLPSLLPNTQYYIDIWAFDTFRRNTSSTSEIFGMTYANVPTSSAAVADSQTQITVSWEANSNPTSTEYYVENITAGTNSGWITATTSIFTGLTAATNYSFQVQARNGNGVTTTFDNTVNATTASAPAGGGGGGGGSAPAGPAQGDPIEDIGCEEDDTCETTDENPSILLKINNGQIYTNSTTVSITLNANLTGTYQLSTTNVFTGVPSVEFASTNVPFTLPEGDGEVKVYGKFLYDNGKKESIEFDTIILDTEAPSAPGVGVLQTGAVGGTLVLPPFLSGVAEASSTIFIVKQKTSPPYRFSFEKKSCKTQDLYKGAKARLYPTCTLNNATHDAPEYIVSPIEDFALQFDGVNDFVQYRPLEKSPDGSLTIEGWVYTGVDTFAHQVIWSYGSTNDVIALQIQNNSFLLFDDIDNGNKTKSITKVLPEQWYHMAVTISPDGVKQVYVNGEKKTTYEGTQKNAKDIQYGTITLGQRYDKVYPFEGAIDELTIESRVYTQQDITLRIGEHTDLFPVEASILEEVSISFDEGEGCVASSTSNIFTGTLLPNCVGANNPSWSTDIFGTEGFSLFFDGVDDSVEFDEFLPAEDGAFSVSFWVKPIDQVVQHMTLFSYGPANDWLTIDIHNNTIYVWDDINNKNRRILSTPMTRDEWHHIVLSIDADAERRLYIDGELKTSDSGQGITLSEMSSYPLRVGARLDNAYKTHGYIDDVHLFARSISKDEVQTLYTDSIVDPEDPSISFISPSKKTWKAPKVPFAMYLANYGFSSPISLAGVNDDASFTVDNTGDWSYSYPFFFGSGGYQLSITATDPAGNISEPTVVSLAIPLADIPGCMDVVANNYNEDATVDNASCMYDPILGCMDDTAKNYSVTATQDDGLCEYDVEGCTDAKALNYNANATVDNDACTYEPGLIKPDFEPSQEPPATPGDDGGSQDTGSTDGSGSSSIIESEIVADEVISSTEDEVTEIEKESKDEKSTAVFTTVSVPIKKVVQAVRIFIDNPKVEQVNETFVAPVIIVAGAANVAIGFQLPQIIALLKFFFSQPLLLLRRRKQKEWGVVYNAYTKLPVDLATIRVFSVESGNIVRSQVTDSKGRYFLMLDPGRYRVEIHKTGFEKGSEFLHGKEEDSSYANLYHMGEEVDVSEKDSALNVNIPLDPTIQDKPTAYIVKEHVKKTVQFTMSFIGLGVSAVSFIISPKPIIAGFLVLHIIFYAMFHVLAHRKKPGSVGIIRDTSNKETLKNVVVRIFDSAYNKLIDTAVTDRHGQYAALVGPSVYYVTYDKSGYNKKKSEIIDFSSKKTEGLGGVISRNEDLDPASGIEKHDNVPETVVVQQDTQAVETEVTQSMNQNGEIKDDTIDKLKEIAQYGGKDS